MNSTRKGDWMQTSTGRAYWPCDPRPGDVFIEDIAHALSMLCRYGGHARKFYSVAEHSLLVSTLVDPEHQLHALLHDATEAYMVDVPRPLKRHLTNYKEFEELNWRAIAEAFGISPVMPDSVHYADNAILLAEKAALMHETPAGLTWFEGAASYRKPIVDIVGYPPHLAKDLFLRRFNYLTRKAA